MTRKTPVNPVLGLFDGSLEKSKTEQPKDTNGHILKDGDAVRCIEGQGYCMGQVWEDQIFEHSINHIDEIDGSQLGFDEHAGRYGLWPAEAFEYMTPEEEKAADKVECSDCYGSGTGYKECEDCGGRGWYNEHEDYEYELEEEYGDEIPEELQEELDEMEDENESCGCDLGAVPIKCTKCKGTGKKAKRKTK